jgi:hypothetical protein
VPGALIVGMFVGAASAGIAWMEGAGWLMALICYGLGGAAGVVLAALVPLLADALGHMSSARPGRDAAKPPQGGTQSAEMH